jgi:hypothetical protein
MNTSVRTFEVCLSAGSRVDHGALPFDAISCHSNALAVPCRRAFRTRRLFHAGVFDADGDALPNCGFNMMKRGILTTRAVRDAALAEAETLPGAWLFCGGASQQFGHIITRGLGRLWATEALPKSVKLLFVSVLYSKAEHAFLGRLLKTLGIENEYVIVHRPTHVDRLYAAPDLFSEAHDGVASPGFVQWIRGKVPGLNRSRFGRKIYITRDRLSGTVGRHLCEDILEDNLSRAGFDILAPETLSIEDQLAAYAEADTVISADGSALHLLPFAFRPEATCIILKRRSDIPPLITNQLQSFTKARIVEIDAIKDVTWPRVRADNVSLVELDFEDLRAQLVAQGVVDADVPWRCPSAEEVAASRNLGRPQSVGFVTDAERPQFLRQLRITRQEKKSMKDMSEETAVPTFEGEVYTGVLAKLHEKLKPNWYFEVGTFTGKSLSLARCNTIAVDPEFKLRHPTVNAAGKQMFFFQQTSDDFFAGDFLKKNKIFVDLAFLDGMHLFEYLLRDFIETEKAMSKKGVIALHDCCPTTEYMATREFHKGDWTGDVWKTLQILQLYRPDLKIDVTTARPTGLVLIRNLNPRSTVLEKKYDALVKEFMDKELTDFDGGVAGFLKTLNLKDPADVLTKL